MAARLVTGVPASAPHELRRERLLEVLHRHSTRPLIVLVAPAGFGKSTLAATYARDSGAPVDDAAGGPRLGVRLGCRGPALYARGGARAAPVAGRRRLTRRRGRRLGHRHPARRRAASARAWRRRAARRVRRARAVGA